MDLAVSAAYCLRPVRVRDADGGERVGAEQVRRDLLRDLADQPRLFVLSRMREDHKSGRLRRYLQNTIGRKHFTGFAIGTRQVGGMLVSVTEQDQRR